MGGVATVGGVIGDSGTAFLAPSAFAPLSAPVTNGCEGSPVVGLAPVTALVALPRMLVAAEADVVNSSAMTTPTPQATNAKTTYQKIGCRFITGASAAITIGYPRNGIYHSI